MKVRYLSFSLLAGTLLTTASAQFNPSGVLNNEVRWKVDLYQLSSNADYDNVTADDPVFSSGPTGCLSWPNGYNLPATWNIGPYAVASGISQFDEGWTFSYQCWENDNDPICTYNGDNFYANVEIFDPYMTGGSPYPMGWEAITNINGSNPNWSPALLKIWHYNAGGSIDNALLMARNGTNNFEPGTSWNHVNTTRATPFGWAGDNAFVGYPEAEVYYRFNLTESADVTLGTSGDIDSELEVYDGNGILVASDSDSGDGYNALLTVTLCPGTHRVKVYGYGGERGDFGLFMSVDAQSNTVIAVCEQGLIVDLSVDNTLTGQELAGNSFDVCGGGVVIEPSSVTFSTADLGPQAITCSVTNAQGTAGESCVANITVIAGITAPSNDACDGAISLISSTTCNPTPFTTAGATESFEPVTCAGFSSPNALDAWFSFVATSTSQTIVVEGTNAADAVIELFQGTCAGLTSIGCADATYPLTPDETTVEELVQTGLTVGVTYWVRVYDYAHISEAHNFEICVVGLGAAGPANDACDGAISLISSTTCNPTPFTTADATESLAPTGCSGFQSSPNALDTWFSFVATSTSQNVVVEGFNGADAVVEIFQGTCAGPISLGCVDATTTIEQLEQTGLTIGTTYWVRVYDFGHSSEAHNFEICVVEGEGTNVGMEENAMSEFSVFPNPTNGLLNVEIEGALLGSNTLIQVSDVLGRVVSTQRAISGLQQIDLSGEPEGIYVVQVRDGVRVTTRRITLQ